GVVLYNGKRAAKHSSWCARTREYGVTDRRRCRTDKAHVYISYGYLLLDLSGGCTHRYFGKLYRCSFYRSYLRSGSTSMVAAQVRQDGAAKALSVRPSSHPGISLLCATTFYSNMAISNLWERRTGGGSRCH